MHTLTAFIRRIGRRRRADVQPAPADDAEQRRRIIVRQEHYNFLHYSGDVQPDPAEATQICPPLRRYHSTV